MFTKEELVEIIKNSFNKTEVLKKLGIKTNGNNHNMISNYIKKYNIDILHFIKYNITENKNKKQLSDILVQNSTYTSSNHLKERLYKEGLKERKCDLCSQEEIWFGKRMSLILDHINGINNDNRIENLRIVCPNCNATLDTHCKGSRVNKEKININYHLDKCSCGIQKKKTSKHCINCRNSTNRVKNKPNLEILLNDVKEIGYSATGRKYDVSDACIRKWIKNYKLNKN